MIYSCACAGCIPTSARGLTTRTNSKSVFAAISDIIVIRPTLSLPVNRIDDGMLVEVGAPSRLFVSIWFFMASTFALEIPILCINDFSANLYPGEVLSIFPNLKFGIGIDYVFLDCSMIFVGNSVREFDRKLSEKQFEKIKQTLLKPPCEAGSSE